MKRLLACLIVLSLIPVTACARSEPLLDVQVVDLDQGSPLNKIPYSGRDYIEGKPGHRFTVALQNRTGERVLAVLSVDGVNAISGQTAGSSQAGYVLEPWQQVEIHGWRKSYSEVNEFFFTTFANSYATRTFRPQNLGVIGVAAFRERRREPIAYEQPTPMMDARENAAADAAGRIARSEKSASAPSAMPQQIGTGYGERRYDPVTRTEFERESSRPNQLIALFYDSYEALVARGILSERGYRAQPEPFPIGFVPEPP